MSIKPLQPKTHSALQSGSVESGIETRGDSERAEEALLAAAVR